MSIKSSVALCTYNGEKYLAKQLESILNQTISVDEIVVCDDGSTDATIDILSNYQKKFPHLFKIYQNPTNLKSVKNFEKAISLCSHEVIFLSDQDDLWVENKVEIFLNFFKKNSNIQMLASNGYCINGQDEVLDKYSLWDIPIFLKSANRFINYFSIIAYFSNIVTGATLAVRKSFVPELIPFPVIPDYHHDEWMALISSRKNVFEMLDDKLIYYRIHEDQQVGGVFFEKNEKSKKDMVDYFTLIKENKNFIYYKRVIKKISVSYAKNKKFVDLVDEKHKPMINEIVKEIEDLYITNKLELEKKYPIRSFLLKISDQLTGKRKINS